MSIITIRFDKALSAETLAKEKVVKSFGYADEVWSDVSVQFIMWDNSNPSNPQLSIKTDFSGYFPEGRFVTFIDGAIKDIHGNVITRTTP